MAKARVYRAAFEQPNTTKVRVYRAAFEGTVLSTPKVRVYRAALQGTAAVLLNPLSPQIVEPETVVTLAAVLLGGGSADSYTWRRISGPTISLMGTGATRTFRAPSAMPPGTAVVVGVTATIAGVTSPERTVTITVLPQVSWSLQSGLWVGQRPTVPIT